MEYDVVYRFDGPMTPPLSRRIADVIFHDIVRPLASVLSPKGLDLLNRALSLPAGLTLLAIAPEETWEYLRAVGHPEGLAGRVQFARRKALERFRGDAFYFHPWARVRKGPGLTRFESSGTPGVLVTWNCFLAKSLVGLVAEQDARVIRFPYDGEGEPEETPSRWERWSAYKASVRARVFGPYQIVPGATPFAYVRALREGRSLFVLQDVPDPTGASPRRRLLGRLFSLPVGAVRIARAAGAPLYFITHRFQDGELWADVDGPHEMDEQALLDRISEEIRQRPWAWELWRNVLSEHSVSQTHAAPAQPAARAYA